MKQSGRLPGRVTAVEFSMNSVCASRGCRGTGAGLNAELFGYASELWTMGEKVGRGVASVTVVLQGAWRMRMRMAVELGSGAPRKGSSGFVRWFPLGIVARAGLT